MSEKPENLERLDPVWARIRAEAGEIAEREPVMSGFLHASVLNHDRLETVIASHLAEKMGNAEIGARALGEVFEEILVNNPDLGESLLADIMSLYDLDPACVLSRPVLYYKGFHGIASLSGGALDIAKGGAHGALFKPRLRSVSG